MTRTVVIRADGSLSYGMGHVMRGIALAQAFQTNGADVVFVTRNLPGNALFVIRDYDFAVVVLDSDLNLQQDANATLAAAHSRGASIVVADLGHAQTLSQEDCFVDFLQQLRDGGLAVTVVEGLDAECISMRMALPAAAIVVPYFGAQTRSYKVLPSVKLFAGAQYFPFRTEFTRYGGKKKTIEKVARRIVVSMGGGDVAQYNQKIFKALSAVCCGDLDVQMIGQDPTGAVGGNVRLRTVANSRNLAELIRWADLAVVGSGLTRYETALLATPAVVFSLKAAHVGIVEAFATSGAIHHAGWIDHMSVESMTEILTCLIENQPQRARLSQQGLKVTDGLGAARVVAGIRELSAA